MKSHLTSYQQFIQQFQQQSKQNTNKKDTSKIKSVKIQNNTYIHSCNKQPYSRIPCISNNINLSLHLEQGDKVAQKSKKQSDNKKLATEQSLKNNTTQYNHNKFISQITQKLVKIIPSGENGLLGHKISYIEYLQTLKALRMIHQSYEPHYNDLIGELWHQFVSQNHVSNLIFIVGSILKCSYPETNSKNQIDNYLSTKYASLRMTRLELKQSTTQKIQNNYSFKPQINKKQQKLFPNRSKSKQNINKHYHVHSNNKLKTEVEIQTTSPYTYKQQLDGNRIVQNKTERHFDKTGNQRSQILYNQAKSKSAQKKEGKSTIDYEYEKNAKQLTFKPNIWRQRSSQKKNIVKGETSSINRMIKGRVQRQIKSMINDKGSTYNETIIDKLRKRKYQDNLNRLKEEESKKNEQIKKNNENKKDTIVVNIFIQQNKCEKLIYNKGEESINEAAERFIKQYKLGSKEKDKLILELESVVKFSLTSIKQQQQQGDHQFKKM